MKPVLITAVIASFAVASVAHANAGKGKGEGKGRSGVAEATSGTPGIASAASGLNGGWGSVGQVSNGREATEK